MTVQPSKLLSTVPRPLQEQDVLFLAALGWREQWTGTLHFTVGQGTRAIPFQGGGPINLSDLNLIQAYAGNEGAFQFQDQHRRGARKTLGARLVHLGIKSGVPLDWERVCLELTAEQAHQLGLPEELVDMGRLRRVSLPREDLADFMEAPELLVGLARLGFLREKQKEADVPAASGLLSGTSPLSDFLGLESINHLEDLADPDPQDELLEELRGCAIRGQWNLAFGHCQDYVGPVDQAELAAWCALSTLRSRRLTGWACLKEANRWSRLALRLPQTDSSKRLLVEVHRELDSLRERTQKTCA